MLGGNIVVCGMSGGIGYTGMVTQGYGARAVPKVAIREGVQIYRPPVGEAYGAIYGLQVIVGNVYATAWSARHVVGQLQQVAGAMVHVVGNTLRASWPARAIVGNLRRFKGHAALYVVSQFTVDLRARLGEAEGILAGIDLVGLELRAATMARITRLRRLKERLRGVV